MITVEKKSTHAVRDLLRKKNWWGGGHYCHNIDLLAEVKDGPYKLRNILKKNGTMSFYVVYDGDEPTIIAPLFRKKGTATVAGTDEYFDYVDLFYRSDVTVDQLKIAFSSLIAFLKKHKIGRIRWNYIPDDSVSKKLINNLKAEPKQIENTQISFQQYEDYLKSLSKSTKQNLRTAENRLKRGNREYELVSNLDSPLSLELLHQCIDVYCERQQGKYEKGILNQLMAKTFNYSTEMMRKQKGLVVALTIDGDVAAFMFGYINNGRHAYEVPKLAISEKYAFYSPGMILVNRSIQMFAEKTDIRVLDLCRGTEQYKLKMGGKIYHTYNYMIEI